MRISDWSSDVCSSDLLRPQSCDGTRHPRERKARDIPMTNEANAPSASPAVLTRSQAEAEATAAHRARYLAKLTPKIVWFVLPILAICTNLSLILFREPTPSDSTIAFLCLCLFASSPITFYSSDHKTP